MLLSRYKSRTEGDTKGRTVNEGNKYKQYNVNKINGQKDK